MRSRLILFLVSFFITLTVAQISFAKVVPKMKREPEPIVLSEPELVDPYSDKALKNTFFLYQLQEDLKDANQNYRDLNSSIVATEKKLLKTGETIMTLKEQFSLFNDQIQESEKKILNVTDQIALKEQDLTKLSQEIETRKIALAEQKALLEEYIRMQYIQENLYFEGSNLSTAKILLADQSVSETSEQVYTVSLFQEAAGQMLKQLENGTLLLEGMHLQLEGKKKRFDQLREKLQSEQALLQEKKLAKAQLLKDTRGEEQRYYDLIAQSIRQQEETLLEIRALQDNMRYVQRKLRDFGEEVSFGDLKNLVDQRTKEFYEFQFSHDQNAEFQWPVQPGRGISAFFQDAGYRARFGIPHNAVDIPVPQGTPVRAAKDGYVYKAKDNGFGYNYVILTHRDQFTTVYGHFSEILVSENNFVKAGAVIGLSGGMPGTKGAGYLTTGPHVHFEILKEGQYVDPLDYLTLTRLPLENLPQRYANKIEKGEKTDPVLPDHIEEPFTRETLPSYLEDAAKKERDAYERVLGPTKND